MKNKLILDRPKSHKQDRLSNLDEKLKDHKKIVIASYHTKLQSNHAISTFSNEDLDDFFDKFHDTFIVHEAVSKAKSVSNKRKKPLANDPEVYEISAKSNSRCVLNKKPEKQVKCYSVMQKPVTKTKQTQAKKTLNKTSKTCQSDRNILPNSRANLINGKKSSVKKNETLSKRKSANNSRKCTTKKRFNGTGSTATTTLGNSAINLKQDFHGASYLRIKMRAN